MTQSEMSGGADRFRAKFPAPVQKFPARAKKFPAPPGRDKLSEKAADWAKFPVLRERMCLLHNTGNSPAFLPATGNSATSAGL